MSTPEKYFECNLPEKAPAYLPKEKRERLEQIMLNIRARHIQLMEACKLSKMQPEVFAKHAKDLFDMDQEHFDKYTVSDIAVYCSFFKSRDEKLPERPNWPNAITLYDTAFASVSEWEVGRLLGSGGSDRAIEEDKSPWRTGRGLRADKRGEALPADDSKQAIFDQGHKEEERVILRFCEMTGAAYVPETRMFQSRKYPACTANPDAIVQWPTGMYSIFEAKTSSHQNAHKWAGGRIPEYYEPQMRHYAGVLNDDRIEGVYIGCLFMRNVTLDHIYVGSEFSTADFRTGHIIRDQKREDEALRACQEWWDEYVVKGTPIPPVDERDVEMSRELAGPSDETIPEVVLDADAWGKTIEEWVELDEKRKALTREADAIKENQGVLVAELMEELGGATAATLKMPGEDGKEYKITFKGKKSVKIDKDFLDEYFPEAFAACSVETESKRSFSVTQVKKKKQAKKSATAKDAVEE